MKLPPDHRHNDPALGENFDSRLVVALNKIDVASYGYEWDYIADRPSPEVEVWPESTASLLRHCILDESGLEIAPVCFAAGFTRTNELSPRPFNLLKLFGAMLGKLPAEKQLTLINSPLNSHSLAWFDSDDRRNYLVEVENVLFDTLYEARAAVPDSVVCWGRTLASRAGRLVTCCAVTCGIK